MLKKISVLFDLMLALGFVFVIGRFLGIAIDYPLLQFFHTYTLESFIVLAVGIVGSNVTRRRIEKEKEIIAPIKKEGVENWIKTLRR